MFHLPITIAEVSKTKHALAYFISGVMISAAKLSEGSCLPRGINPE